MQMYVFSISVQSALHPSAPDVLPSSHTSPVTLLPSPQMGTQVSFPVFGWKPSVQAVHVSILDVLPPEHT